MDPITAIGLLASLSSLIQTSNVVLDLLKSFKDAERELLELYSDVCVFKEALRGFDRVLRSRQTKHNISAAVINLALEESLATIQELEKKLVQVSTSEVSAWRRVKWVQYKSSYKKLHERLKDQSAMLQSFLSLVHTETFLAVCSQHPQFLEICSDAADEEDSDAVSFQSSTLSETTTFTSGSSLSVDTLPSSVGSSVSSLRKLSLDPDPPFSHDQLSKSSIQYTSGLNGHSKGSPAGALTIRRSCRFDCYCVCHIQNTAYPSKNLSMLTTSKYRCNEPNCLATTFQESVEKPTSFFRRVMSQVASSHNIKIRYDLNTYRMVPEGSDAMRYVKHGNLEKLKLCLNSGEATLWDTAPDGWSLLHTAAYNRHPEIVNYLLELGADTETADIGTRKPADLAILRSLGADATYVEHEIVEVFSKKDDYISDFEFTPIHIAVLGLYDATDLERPSLEQLIQVYDDANNAPAGTNWAKWKRSYRKRSPLFGQIIELFRASAFGKPMTYKVIHDLLNQKDRKYCWTPLHWASSAGRTDKMKILIDHGADPFILSNLDANILHAAAESKTTDGLTAALEIQKRYPQQLNINQANRWLESPLHVAAWGSVGCVKLLLEAGADRNVRQEDQQVPLHCAGLSSRGDVRREIVALLCDGEGELDIDAQDVDGRPPIFDFLDCTQCLEILTNHRARLDLLDKSGKSVFHHACIQDESEALKLLLRLNLESVMVTVKDHDGNTALIQALCHGSFDCAMILLELDDVGDVVGQGGWTAAHYAAKLGDVELLEAVLKHPSFVRGMKTIDGKTLEVVAMEASNWCGETKRLLREYNSLS